jgi:hypothetical protein
VPRGQRHESLRPYSRLSRPQPLLFLPGSSSVVLTRLSGPVPHSLLLRKSGSAGNRTRTSGSYVPLDLSLELLKLNSVASVRKRTISTERPPLVSEVSANFFEDKRCHVVSVTNPYDRILGFIDKSLYYFFQVAPQLYSRG